MSVTASQLRAVGAAAMMSLAVASRAAWAQGTPEELALAATRGVDVREHTGQTLPLELQFTTSTGAKVRLGDYFKPGNTKPAIVALVYYDCPMVCDTFLAKTAHMMGGVSFTPGVEYQTLVFSFDKTETPARAAEVRPKYVDEFMKSSGRDAPPEDGWVFHVSDDDAVKQLAESVGFIYRRAPDGVNFLHPIVKVIVTPDGKISRYLYGYEQPTRDLKLALLEASEGKLVSTLKDRVMAYCYSYDMMSGKYTLRALRVMQLGGVVTLVGLGSLLGLLFAGERLRRRRRGGMGSNGSHSDGAGATPAVMG